jgi:hypothetical protein
VPGLAVDNSGLSPQLLQGVDILGFAHYGRLAAFSHGLPVLLAELRDLLMGCGAPGGRLKRSRSWTVSSPPGNSARRPPGAREPRSMPQKPGRGLFREREVRMRGRLQADSFSSSQILISD